MYAFRTAYEEGDARTKVDERQEGARVLSNRATLRRRGVDEATLRADFMNDLTALANCINLQSVINLDDYKRVRASVLNYGLDDVGRMTSEDRAVDKLATELTSTLLRFEPRLSSENLSIEKRANDEVNHRVRFEIAGMMKCRPYNVPIEFIAEVDVASGLVHLNQGRSIR
ncbi:GPW/gp25 family protein [Fulvimarina sp. MAC3]|uniref:type VI secretion system baseplate subunit TssE n=1 Tax=Fulvimarina sp. MAC3 TaxID=3148887 RepID=UPI0031FC3549